MLALAIILLVLWALGFFAFHVAGGLIHILLVLALVVFVVNLIRGRSAI
ncbi:MAG: lmo0937 family membrane protein [Novosphingobium sp.]